MISAHAEWVRESTSAISAGARLLKGIGNLEVGGPIPGVVVHVNGLVVISNGRTYSPFMRRTH